VAPGAPAPGATSCCGSLLSPLVSVLNAAARGLIESSKPAHLVTVNPDGSPQVTMVWVGLNGEELVSGHLDDRQKLRNVRRDPRVVLSLETGVVNDFGLAEYVTVTGSGYVTDGGAADLLQQLAHVYLGPDVTFPPGENHPPGYILHITPERVGGIGPWRD
jgi:PPOX class probable F420-dependent enzyme